mmetsp:Transcript_15087/g.47362  ORF Transcript_15087/g.47362 Transcript_15087/m.47362 type:complete len:336 (+) Transcript_15087:18-1025(+)
MCARRERVHAGRHALHKASCLMPQGAVLSQCPSVGRQAGGAAALEKLRAAGSSGSCLDPDALLLHRLVQQLHAGAQRADRRGLRPGEVRQLHDGHDEGIHLRGLARLHVLQGGGLVRPDPCSTTDPAVDGHVEHQAQLPGDLKRLLHRLPHHGDRRRVRRHDVQRGVRQRADGVEAEVSQQLDPHVRADVLEDRGLEAGGSEGRAQAADPLRGRPVELAQRQQRALGVDHLTGRPQVGSRIWDAAHDPVGRDGFQEPPLGVHRAQGVAVEGPAVLQEVPPGQAVLHGHDDGRVVEELGQVVEDGVDLVRLQGYHHDVHRPALRHAANGAHGHEGL